MFTAVIFAKCFVIGIFTLCLLVKIFLNFYNFGISKQKLLLGMDIAFVIFEK